MDPFADLPDLIESLLNRGDPLDAKTIRQKLLKDGSIAPSVKKANINSALYAEPRFVQDKTVSPPQWSVVTPPVLKNPYFELKILPGFDAERLHGDFTAQMLEGLVLVFGEFTFNPNAPHAESLQKHLADSGMVQSEEQK